jgi:hypothetical protein
MTVSRPPSPSALAAPVAICIFLAAGVLLACGGGSKAPETTTYAQADLAGTWDFVMLATSAYPGWERTTATLDATGAVSVVSFLDDQGHTTSGAADVVLKVDGDGAVTQTFSGSPFPLHGFLARSKKLVAAVYTRTTLTYSLVVGRKRDAGVTWSNADIRDRTFALHSLREGVDGWRYGVGAIGSNGVVTITSAIGPSLTSVASPPPDGATLSVDGEGFVSDGGSFHGFLTDDKDTIFAVHTDNGRYVFTVLQFTGGTFAQRDLAGTWGFSSISTNAWPIWQTGKLAIDAAGAGTFPSYLDSSGAPKPNGATYLLDPEGLITISNNPSYRGTLALGHDMYVRTQTYGLAGRYGVAVALRR